MARWYTIGLGDAPGDVCAPAERLDVSRLQELVLDAAARHRRRADRQAHRLRRRRSRHAAARDAGRSGRAAVAFSLYPVSVDDLMAISDAGGIMPPKSTWFEPKLRDGLLSHVI